LTNKTIDVPDLAGWPLDIRIDRDDGVVTVTISGEIDIGSADIVDRTIGRVQESDATKIVVDLTEVTFLDSTALEMLLKVATRDRNDGRRLTFVPSRHDAVKQLIAVSGVSQFFQG